MPDLLSHVLIGLILAELFNVKKKSLVVLGAIAPDILSKFYLIYFYFNLPPIISFVPFHTQVMMFLLSIVIAPLFRQDNVKIILLFNLGAMSHILADLTMKHFTVMGSRIFFPFDMSNYTLNLIWPDDSLFILLGCFVIYIIIRSIKGNLNSGMEISKTI